MPEIEIETAIIEAPENAMLKRKRRKRNIIKAKNSTLATNRRNKKSK